MNKEIVYIDAMSQAEVVDAYANWTEISEAERLCLDKTSVQNAKILDLGCGAGRFANLLSQKAQLYQGVDASSEMLRIAKNKYPGVTFSEGNILSFDTKNNYWDTILLMGNVLDCLNPYSRRIKALNRCFNWLKPGGKIIGSSHLTKSNQPQGYYEENYHGSYVENYRLSLDESISEVENCGFEVILICRDYRKIPADWCYWVAQKKEN